MTHILAIIAVACWYFVAGAVAVCVLIYVADRWSERP